MSQKNESAAQQKMFGTQPVSSQVGEHPHFPHNLQIGGRQQMDRDNDVIEIDLLEILFALRRHLVLLIIATLIGTGIAAAVNTYMIPKTYTSSSLMLILTKETTLSSLADLQLGTSLTGDYTILINSRPVLEEVVDELDLDMDYKGLRSKLSVTNQTDTRILKLEVVDTDPEMAKIIVDEVARVSAKHIGQQMEMTPPRIIEKGEIPLAPTGPNEKKNLMLGGLAAFMLAAAFVVIRELLNDALMTEDDVERYLGLITLANVPMKEEPAKVKKTRKEKRADKKARKMQKKQNKIDAKLAAKQAKIDAKIAKADAKIAARQAKARR